jgi:hypothetical protein
MAESRHDPEYLKDNFIWMDEKIFKLGLFASKRTLLWTKIFDPGNDRTIDKDSENEKYLN